LFEINKVIIKIVKMSESLLKIVGSYPKKLFNVAELAIIILAMTFNMINMQK
jgi:hypothetical protein